MYVNRCVRLLHMIKHSARNNVIHSSTSIRTLRRLQMMLQDVNVKRRLQGRRIVQTRERNNGMLEWDLGLSHIDGTLSVEARPSNVQGVGKNHPPEERIHQAVRVLHEKIKVDHITIKSSSNNNSRSHHLWPSLMLMITIKFSGYSKLRHRLRLRRPIIRWR